MCLVGVLGRPVTNCSCDFHGQNLKAYQLRDSLVTCFFADDVALPVSFRYDLQFGLQLSIKQL